MDHGGLEPSESAEEMGPVFHLLCKEGSDTRTSRRFYVVVVQSVLIFGYKSCVSIPQIIQALSSIHNWVAQRISVQNPRYWNVRWEYPPIGEALAEAGLGPIGECISYQHTSVA